MITVFVSSTFRDMQSERDALQTMVAPFINQEAQQYGQTVDFCDLRWGINTVDMDTEEGSKKVLEVCFDEIDRCEPPMIVLLGYRYGWIPDSELVRNAASEKNLQLDDLEKSVTALEIEYGAFIRNPGNTLFYFREIEGDYPPAYGSENEQAAVRLAALKKRIRDLSGGRVKEYRVRWNDGSLDGIDDFAEQVKEDVLDILLPRFKKEKKQDPFAAECALHEEYLKQRADEYFTRTALAEELIERAKTVPSLLIEGEAGSGKTTLLAYMYKRFLEEGYEVLPFVAGCSEHSNTAQDIVRIICHYISQKTDNSLYYDYELYPKKDVEKNYDLPKNFSEWRAHLFSAILSYAQTGGKLVILIDSVDDLLADEYRDARAFIPFNEMISFKNIHLVYTCEPGLYNDPSAASLPAFSEEDRKAVLTAALSRLHREIAPVVAASITAKKTSDNPLYVNLLLKRLTLLREEDFSQMGDANAITEYQRKVIDECPDSLKMMHAHIMRLAASEIDGRLMTEVLGFIAASREGVRASDLAALCPDSWNQLSFVRFIHYMNDSFLLRKDGRYDFAHMGVREGIETFLGDLSSYEDRLVEHWLGLPTKDPIRKKELAVGLIARKRIPELVDYIIYCRENKKKYSIKIVAQALANAAMQDEGDFLISILHSEAGKEALHTLVRFFNFGMASAFPEGERSLRIQSRVVEELHALCQKEYEKDKSREDVEALKLITTNLACLYDQFGLSSYTEKKLSLHLRSLELAEELLRIEETPLYLSWLATSHGNIANTLMQLGGKENREKALEHAKKKVELRRNILSLEKKNTRVLDLSYALSDLADIVCSYGKLGDYYEAFELYKEAFEPFYEGELPIKSNSEYAKRIELSRKIAEIYAISGKKNDMEEALDMLNDTQGTIAELSMNDPNNLTYKKQEIKGGFSLDEVIISPERRWRNFLMLLHVCREVYAMDPSPKLKRMIASALLRLGDFLKEKIVGKAEKALDFYRKAFDLLDGKGEGVFHASERRLVMGSQRRLGEALASLGGAEREEGIELLRRALSGAEEHFEKEEDPNSAYLLATAEASLAEALGREGNTPAYEEALSLISRAVERAERTMEETGLLTDAFIVNEIRERRIRILFVGSKGEKTEEIERLKKELLSSREEIYDELQSAKAACKLMETYRDYADRASEEGDVTQAAELYGKAIPLCKELYLATEYPPYKEECLFLYDYLIGHTDSRLQRFKYRRETRKYSKATLYDLVPKYRKENMKFGEKMDEIMEKSGLTMRLGEAMEKDFGEGIDLTWIR